VPCFSLRRPPGRGPPVPLSGIRPGGPDAAFLSSNQREGVGRVWRLVNTRPTPSLWSKAAAFSRWGAGLNLEDYAHDCYATFSARPRRRDEKRALDLDPRGNSHRNHSPRFRRLGRTRSRRLGGKRTLAEGGFPPLLRVPGPGSEILDHHRV